MSQINNKPPKPQTNDFGPLNGRRETVGKTYGERRERANSAESSSNWLQRAKDFFSITGKKQNNISEFSNAADRYEGVRNEGGRTLQKAAQLYDGSGQLAKVQRPENEKYALFLDSVIQYIDAKKPPKKV
ncbi:MAG: hypothetical protein Q7T03_01150 [Deltaproteobacteria bacterium]|nr:hypothetical protein [Deltaproteobacteria bacterium]